MLCRMLLALLALAVGKVGAVEPLTPEQMAGAIRLEGLSVPVAGELFAALGGLGEPNWQSLYRPPIATSYTSRAQIALNLGGLIADGHLGVEAADSQQVNNVAKDILALAKPLGVSQNILARGNSLMEFADRNEWNTLREELEATQNELENSMAEQGDTELAGLVSLGGWVRATEVISAWLVENPAPDNSKILRQPALAGFLRAQVETLSERAQDDPVVRELRKKLESMEKLTSQAREVPPTAEEVAQLHAAAAELVAEISKKE